MHVNTGLFRVHLQTFHSAGLVIEGRWFESTQERRENFLLQGQLSVLTYFGISSTLVLPQQHVKDPGHSPAECAGDS